MSKEKAKGYINTAISICEYYFEGDDDAKKLAIKHLKEALKELKDEESCIKPTSTYRPFANAEECWEEMKKHEPFGWLTLKEFTDNHAFLDEINDSLSFDMYFKEYTFADGAPFGKLTEEG